jgi:hypothetical protein
MRKSTTTSSGIVHTLHTPCPDKDAAFLQGVFPQSELEKCQQSKGTCLVLVIASLETTFIFLPAKDATTMPCVMVVEESSSSSVTTFESAAVWTAANEAIEGEIDGITIREIALPGSGSIWLVPPVLVASSSGRQALALRLLNSSEGPGLPHSNEGPGLPPAPHVKIAVDGDEVFHDIDFNSSFAATPTSVSPLPSPSSSSAMGGSVKIPSLHVELLEKVGKWRSNVPLNSQIPIPVETDLFQGHMLLLIRPPNPEDDPYWNNKIFSRMKRRIVFQIQGKLKYEPAGVIYAGAEVSNPMKLGLITRGLASVLLRLVETFNSNVHYSFGDTKGLEKGHIVVPAYTFFEQVIATPPGQIPPPIGELFVESVESIAARKRDSNLLGKWNAVDTYSLSFYSMYIDLPTWQLVGLPVSGNISLKTFWGNALLRICMYERQADDREKKHLHEFNKYILAVQVCCGGLSHMFI